MKKIFVIILFLSLSLSLYSQNKVVEVNKNDNVEYVGGRLIGPMRINVGIGGIEAFNIVK